MSRSLVHRLRLVLILLVTVAGAEAAGGSTATAALTRPDSAPVRLVAFRGHFGGVHLGGGRRSRFGFGGVGRRGGSRGIFRRIARALAFAYILHVLFSHGGLSLLIWLVIIGLLIALIRRRRRRRLAYY